MVNVARWQVNPHGFFAVHMTVDRARPVSHREAADALNREFHLSFDRSTVTRIISTTIKAMEEPEIRKQYEEYLRQLPRPRGVLFRRELKGSREIWVSDYDEGKRFLIEKKNKKSITNMIWALNGIYDDLGKISPAKWTYEVVKPYIDKLDIEKGKAVAFTTLVFIRNLLPQRFKASGETPLATTDYKPSLNETIKTYDLFSEEAEKVIAHIEKEGNWFIAGLHKLHVILGCREGTYVHETDKRRSETGRGGLLGLLWRSLNERDNTIDVFEGKTKGGILWRGCPLDNFGWDVWPFLRRLRALREPYIFEVSHPVKGRTEQRTSTVTVKHDDRVIFRIGYRELLFCYEYINKVYRQLFPNLKFDKVTPHASRHLHTNLLFERGVDGAVICGDAIRGEGFVGVGWLTKDTMEKYYLSLVRRKVQHYIDAAKKARGQYENFAQAAPER